MTDKNIYCSADEYAYLEDMHRRYTAKLERLKTLRPGTAFADSAPKIEHIAKGYESALAAFAVRPGSERTENPVLSTEFQKQIMALNEGLPEFTGIVLKG